MNRTRYGTSLWQDRPAPAKPPTFPTLRDAHETEVVVIGGGLSGCLIACQFSRAGIRTTVIDADRVGATAALDAGWIVESPGVPFREVQQEHGLRDARRAFEASRRAALDVAAFLRRLEIRCDLAPRQSLTLALSAGHSRASSSASIRHASRQASNRRG